MTGNGAPALDVVGSYFPAWMLCAIVGIVVAIIVRQVLVLLDLETSLPVPLLTHLGVALIGTLAVWLVWFGH